MGKQERFGTVLNSASDLYAVVMHFRALVTQQRLQADWSQTFATTHSNEALIELKQARTLSTPTVMQREWNQT